MDFRTVDSIWDAYRAADLNETVHPNDVMFNTGPSHYWTVGRSAVQVTLSGLTLSWTQGVNRILDLPCGHGRVARHLRAAFPTSKMFFCDIDAEGADFCAAQFGGTAIHSNPDLMSVDLPRDLDLIWVGSLFTHLDRERSEAWLRYLTGHLRPHGLIVATYHGLFSSELLGKEGEIDGASLNKMYEQFLRTGYGYDRYSGADDYGLSLSHPATIVGMATAIPETRIVSYVERGWAFNHDVLILAKQDRLVSFAKAVSAQSEVAASAEEAPEAAAKPPSSPTDHQAARVVIHIGVHKTGSSAVQTLLHRNADKLSEQGFYYAPTLPDDWPNHNPLALCFRTDAPSDEGETAMAALLANAKNRTPILSAEMLCESGIDLNRFMDTLRGYRVEVVAYLRHPCDMIVSAFNELTRSFESGWTVPINEEPFGYDPSQFDAVRQWLSRDDATVTLAPYDRGQWPNGSLFVDFLHMIGASPVGMDTTDQSVNESLSFAAAERLRRLIEAGGTKEQHAALLAELRRSDVTDDDYPLTQASGEICLQRMRYVLPTLRPHFREGFNEGYLLEPRPWRRPEGGHPLA